MTNLYPLLSEPLWKSQFLQLICEQREEYETPEQDLYVFDFCAMLLGTTKENLHTVYEGEDSGTFTDHFVREGADTVYFPEDCFFDLPTKQVFNISYTINMPGNILDGCEQAYTIFLGEGFVCLNNHAESAPLMYFYTE
jgi:hypothetical protein